MPGTMTDALHTLSHFTFKASLQSKHQYPHFIDQEGEMQTAQVTRVRSVILTEDSCRSCTWRKRHDLERVCDFSELFWDRILWSLI